MTLKINILAAAVVAAVIATVTATHAQRIDLPRTSVPRSSSRQERRSAGRHIGGSPRVLSIGW